MTLSHSNDSSFLPSHNHPHHQIQPQNFSRPHLHSLGPSSSSNSSSTLNGAVGNGWTNGLGSGPKLHEGLSHNIPNEKNSLQSPASSRMSSIGSNTSPDRDDRPNPGLQHGLKMPAAPAGSIAVTSATTPSENSGFPSSVNGSVLYSQFSTPSTAPIGDHYTQSTPSLSSPSQANARTADLNSTPSTQLSPNRLSSPQNLPSSSNTPGAQTSQQLPASTVLRQRQTLQVPQARNNRISTPASGSDTIASGFSPTSAAAVPRRTSVSLGRRGTRSLSSDMHIDQIPQDEDAAKWAEVIKAKRASKRRKQEDAEDDKVVVGTKVDHNHVNWVTAYNMLTGIRFVVSRVNAKMDRPLTDADFDAKHKFSFDMYVLLFGFARRTGCLLRRTGNELTPSAKYDFKFKDYSPWVFRHLRAKFRLDPADYLMSLTSKYILSELGSPGKSGSFFYFSRDYKYIIKTIHHGEHLFLRRILRDYYKHVEENPNTLISQFYGLHRVKTPFGPKIHFVVMNNLFPPHRDIHQTFDLKGSTIGRDYPEEKLAANPRATQKDLNWLRRDMHLNFGPEKKDMFLQQVERDVQLLQKLCIMDYSLLIGIHDLTVGNRDDIRNNELKVFQPGGVESDELQGHVLQRTPSKMEKARQARELRKIINSEIPVSLDRSANRLPEEFLEQKNTVFYGDDGGFRATHDNNEPADVIYYLGIIDCLTHYGTAKKMEHFWRGLSHPKDQVSAIPPHGYGERFFKFISGLIKSPEEAARDKAASAADPSNTAEAITANPSTDLARDGQRSARNSNDGSKNIRAPSMDRSGGASGTALPVVEEAGEGSTTGRSLSRDGSGSERRRSAYTESVTDHTTDHTVRVENLYSGSPTLNLGTGAIKQKHEPDDLAIRVARVSS
ncbi:Phosphatidylinositol-4-phosphate 5-kinase [Rhizina undulata]